MKTLRIIFTIVSAIFAAGVVPLGFLFSWWAAIACALGAMIFFGAMILCKNAQEKAEATKILPLDETTPTQDEETKAE